MNKNKQTNKKTWNVFTKYAHFLFLCCGVNYICYCGSQTQIKSHWKKKLNPSVPLPDAFVYSLCLDNSDTDSRGSLPFRVSSLVHQYSRGARYGDQSSITVTFKHGRSSTHKWFAFLLAINDLINEFNRSAVVTFLSHTYFEELKRKLIMIHKCCTSLISTNKNVVCSMCDTVTIPKRST